MAGERSLESLTVELQEAITDKLRETLGEDGVEILTEYVWHMLVSPKRNRQHIVQELQEFLAEETENFVEWLLSHIVPLVDSRLLRDSVKEEDTKKVEDVKPILFDATRNDIMGRETRQEFTRTSDSRPPSRKTSDSRPSDRRPSDSRIDPRPDIRSSDPNGRGESRGDSNMFDSRLSDSRLSDSRMGRTHTSQERRERSRKERPGRLLGIAFQAATDENARYPSRRHRADDAMRSSDGPGPYHSPRRRVIKERRGASRSPDRAHARSDLLAMAGVPRRVMGHPDAAADPRLSHVNRPPLPPFLSRMGAGMIDPTLLSLPLEHQLAAAGLMIAPINAKASFPLKKVKKRCAKWPDCPFGDDCKFVHPTEMCLHWPRCPFGMGCFYIHPEVPCKFGLNCFNATCNYTHPEGWDCSVNMAKQSMHSAFFANKSLNLAPIEVVDASELSKTLPGTPPDSTTPAPIEAADGDIVMGS